MLMVEGVVAKEREESAERVVGLKNGRGERPPSSMKNQNGSVEKEGDRKTCSLTALAQRKAKGLV